MDPNISLPSDDRNSKRRKVVLYDDDKDEDFNDAIDKMCTGIKRYTYYSPIEQLHLMRPRVIDKPRLDPQGSWSSCSRFLAFSQKYKSKFETFMETCSRVGIYPKKDVLPDPVAKTCSIATLDDEEILKRYKNFKRFDTVKDYSDHLFSAKPMEQRTDAWVQRIREEWRILDENLPETIFVRAYEERMDLLRAVIIGPKGTPYHDGLFFFDLYFPSMHPLHLPLVRYHSGGFGIHPYMFECGEVRFNIRTFSSNFRTTVLQLLVYIQESVFKTDPLFDQRGFLDSGPSVITEYFSLLYNEDILIRSLKTMMHIMNKPPKNFEAFVVGHFRKRVLDIIMTCKAYKDGLKVGGDVGNKDICCSIQFRINVYICISQLVECFIQVGAKEAYKFRRLKTQTLPASLTNKAISDEQDLSDATDNGKKV